MTAVLLVTAPADNDGAAPTKRQQLRVYREYDRAEDEARSALHVAQKEFGAASLEALTAADVLVCALIRNGRAWSGVTLTLAVTTLEAKESLVGPRSADLVPSLVNAGDAFIAGAQYERGITFLQRAAALQEAVGAPTTSASADVRDRLGIGLSAAGRNDEALSILERNLRTKDSAKPIAVASIARTLEAIGSAAQSAGRYARAGEALRRARTLQASVDPRHPAFVETLNLLAQQLWFEGDLPGSKDISHQAVTLAGHTLRATHPAFLEALRYLASTLGDLGDLAQSHSMRLRALRNAEAEFGTGHYETAGYLNGLAISERRLGAYTAARARFERVLTAVASRYGLWHDFVATTRLNLAVVSVNLGDYQRSRQELAQAISIWERAGGRDHPFVAVALSELAEVFNEEARPNQALPLLQRALAIREKNLGPDHRDVARTLLDLASTVAAVGRPARAEALATRALHLWERLGTPDAPEFATMLALYAKLQADRGDAAAAREYYERALGIRAKVFGAAHPLYAEAQTGLASALANLGDRGAALGTAASAEVTGRDHLRLMLRSLPERQALQYAAARPRGLNLMFSLAGSEAVAIPVALDGLIRSRALVLDEIAARHRAGRAVGESTDPAHAAMTSAQQRLANLLVRGPGQMSPAQYTTLVESARREGEVAEQALAERSADFRAEQSRTRIGTDEVLASLPADGAVVSFARYDRTIFMEPARTPLPRAPTRASRAVPSYLAFVLHADRPPAVVPLGSVQAIDTLVSQWRVDIAAEALAPPTPGELVRSSRGSGAALRRRVWDRLAEHIGDARRVFIVPDGSLSLVPFAALPVGQRSYLLEAGPVIHYLSAERDLVPLPQTPGASRGLLAVGGPSFNDRTLFRARARPAPTAAAPIPPTMLRGAPRPCGGLESITFQPLDGTRQEVRDLSGVWNANVPPDSEPARVLLGRDASEATFKRDAPGYRVLHLATHGFFLSGDCAPAASGGRGVGGLSTARVPGPAENPLLLSGLALAGANRRASAGPDEDDGILTAEEVASLNLEGVEWAVLSACDTGVGEIRAGEGVFGLRRAFQVAGARTVVMSLWSVDDQATRAWMQVLYQGRFETKLSTADAVHATSLAVLRERRAKGQSTHPFYWAAFVAAGDWR